MPPHVSNTLTPAPARPGPQVVACGRDHGGPRLQDHGQPGVCVCVCARARVCVCCCHSLLLPCLALPRLAWPGPAQCWRRWQTRHPEKAKQYRAAVVTAKHVMRRNFMGRVWHGNRQHIGALYSHGGFVYWRGVVQEAERPELSIAGVQSALDDLVGLAPSLAKTLQNQGTSPKRYAGPPGPRPP
jgi:hypothetical protein